MRIAIIENEFNILKASFDAVNLLLFDNSLKFEIYETSQSFNVNNANNFELIFIDLDLSSKSKNDGYDLVQRCMDNNIDKKKIIILTGHINVEQKLNELNISGISILTKPINFDKLSKSFQQINNK